MDQTLPKPTTSQPIFSQPGPTMPSAGGGTPPPVAAAQPQSAPQPPSPIATPTNPTPVNSPKSSVTPPSPNLKSPFVASVNPSISPSSPLTLATAKPGLPTNVTPIQPAIAQPVGAPSMAPPVGKSPPPTPVGMTPPSPAARKTALPVTPGQPPQKSIFRFLPILILVLFGLAAAAGAVYYFFIKPTGNVEPITPTPVTKQTITYWGLWEPEAVLTEVFADFEAANPEYKIQYTKQSPVEYRARLQAAIANSEGPDIFRFHASWTPMMRNELSPLPERTMTPAEFGQTFYPVAQEQLTLNGQIMGIPLMYDGLALYYNKDVLTIANKTPPKTWEDLKEVAQAVTLKSGTTITRGGIAMGTANNVEHFSEIVAVLMLQNGADPSKPSEQKAIEALQFYTDFSAKLGVWDSSFPLATEAFAKGNVAMMIAPSWRAHEIMAANPNLNFATAPLPQLADGQRTTWASFWAEGVNAKSSQRDGAWKLLKYLSSAEVQQKFYSETKKVRVFGEIYARKDLASSLAGDPYVAAYVEDAPYARSWYLNAYTHDQGINDRIIKLYSDLLISGQSKLAAGAGATEQGITQVLTQYGIVASTQ